MGLCWCRYGVASCIGCGGLLRDWADAAPALRASATYPLQPTPWSLPVCTCPRMPGRATPPGSSRPPCAFGLAPSNGALVLLVPPGRDTLRLRPRQAAASGSRGMHLRPGAKTFSKGRRPSSPHPPCGASSRTAPSSAVAVVGGGRVTPSSGGRDLSEGVHAIADRGPRKGRGGAASCNVSVARCCQKSGGRVPF